MGDLSDDFVDKYFVDRLVSYMILTGAWKTTTGNWIFEHSELSHLPILFTSFHNDAALAVPTEVGESWLIKHENDIYKALVADHRVANVELTSRECFDIVFYLVYCPNVEEEKVSEFVLFDDEGNFIDPDKLRGKLDPNKIEPELEVIGVEGTLEQDDLSTVKDKAGKPRMSLILPNANAAVVRVREYGLQKYPDAENWRKVDNADWLDAAMRHLLKYMDGAEYDAESECPHLWHALCDLSYLVENLYPTALWEEPHGTKE